MSKQHNFELPLREGDFPTENRKLVGVPNRLTKAQRERYIPYLIVEHDNVLIGVLDRADLRRLRQWLNRVLA